MTAFARDAGLDPGTMPLEIRKLEQDLGGELLVPGGVKRPLRLTRLGKKVAAAAARVPASSVISPHRATNKRVSPRPSCDDPRA
ncbi:hypothetical protein ACIQ1J_31325 [Streptomyces sp. NPDC097107]|uniref:hypothetical protein n=1 Tax=Streptomyces sp. NPDC097107 TaxID=3366089 RepID=UPI0038194717